MTQADSDDVLFSFGPRRYRVRGLARNTTYERLQVNLLVRCEGAAGLFVDVLDLYSALQRAAFVREASLELELDPGVLKADLGQLLLKLEAEQQTRLQASMPREVEVTASDRAAAEAYLRAPSLLGRVLEDFDACGVVGERANKVLAYLAATSRLLPDPLAVVIQSSSSAGKSSLMDAVLGFMPPEAVVRYSALTSQALYYAGQHDLKHKVLALVEEEGASRAAYALKLLQSERELTISTTGKDKQGRMSNQAYRVEGPVSLFLTTTSTSLDPELMNRSLVLSVDESPSQTAAIHAAQRARETLRGLQSRKDAAVVRARHHAIQRVLSPVMVVNPFAEQLEFDASRTRARRDQAKLLALVRAVTLLHQYQRPRKVRAATRTSRRRRRTSRSRRRSFARCWRATWTSWRRRRAACSTSSSPGSRRRRLARR